jgi:hypothetical protein
MTTTTKDQLDTGQLSVLSAVSQLNGERRTTNNSQVANRARVSRTYAGKTVRFLAGRRLITDTATGSAPHWRMTAAGKALLAGGQASEPTGIPAMLIAYFERKHFEGPRQTPMITEIWGNGTPWQGVSPTEATYTNIRALKRAGAKSLGIVAYGSLPADFTVAELLDEADKPLLGGAIIGSRTWKAR